MFIYSFPSLNNDEWNGWRGLERQARGDTTGCPVEWTSTKNVVWKVSIEGQGHSSPVVSEENVFITAADHYKSKIGLNSLIIYSILILISRW